MGDERRKWVERLMRRAASQLEGWQLDMANKALAQWEDKDNVTAAGERVEWDD